MSMKALVVVNYQNDHVVGPVSNRYTQLIEGNIVERIEDTLKSKGKVFFLVDSFNESHFRDQKNGVRYCIRATPGAELYGRMNDYSSKGSIIRKETYGSEELLGHLRTFDSIEICGVETEKDILANAIIAKTSNPKAEVVVRQNCVATRNSALAEEALDVLSGIGVRIL